MSMVLVIAGSKQEYSEFLHMMGLPAWQCKYVDQFSVMMMHMRASVYIVGTARERADFPAIEGLFILGHHTVLDMNE